ncbi:peroxiredoxin [Agromyces sp. ISL-38]|uniref:peroxiredoxin n=1 Tax=Agromyces sp. ISL-38 TaxID=2819107 RepID=UPI001BEB04A6|nr:peroxiredoxin [Agromyces sp. ISL-38]MBT2500856.1 peroxiredoxin [Agromyces sp. ISL-38]MBT2518825.1 peroxiredoxin [Streptomyces sp. ISL-90]
MILARGAVAPDFALANQFGQTVRLGDITGSTPVTLVFFPLAFSRVCHGELCELRDNVSMFEAAGTQLIGVSVDSKHTLRAWAEAESYGFPLLSDFWPHGAVAASFGAFDESTGLALRATFVIGVDGFVRESFTSPRGEARSLDQYREALAAR